MTISLQLKQLEKEGLVTRTVYFDKPPIRVTYDLIALVKSLIPLLNIITEWGNTLVINQGTFE